MNIPSSGIILVSGSTRSGKSEWAEMLLKNHKSVFYLATSQKSDDKDWQKRIKIHKDRRPKNWITIEEPSDITNRIINISPESSIILDSLGGFVTSNIKYSHNDWTVLSQTFVKALKQSESLIVVVIEETGWGVVPPTKIGNLFIDRLNLLAQHLETSSVQSWLLIHGRAINLKNISISPREYETY